VEILKQEFTRPMTLGGTQPKYHCTKETR